MLRYFLCVFLGKKQVHAELAHRFAHPWGRESAKSSGKSRFQAPKIAQHQNLRFGLVFRHE
jgi:hypothetical protein